MSSTFISISPIKRRQCGTAFITPLSSNNTNQLCAAPSKYHHHQSGQYQRVPFHPFIVCSPLVCRSNKLNLQHEEDTTTSTSSPVDTDDVVSLINIESSSHMLDSFEIGYNHIDSIYTSGDPTRKEAPLVTATAQYPSKGYGNGGLLIKEGRSGIRTRNHFQPSRKYEKVWEDIAPPSTAAKTRHSDVKARSKRFNEQISLEQSLLKTSAGSAGKEVYVQKKTIEAKKTKVVHFSSKPAVIATNHRSTLSNSNAKSTDAPITPTDVDVLFGRGGMTNTHNTKFREQVRKYVDRYQQTARDEKTIVSTELVNSVKGYGGRFLALDNGSWYEVDDKKAKLKVSQALRERKHR
ncbi:hypothetical protein QTG54_002213 [Skeletonema marinoi]|uniref:DUF6824 domain-containing protein n=1 Tax=Skeletonema marinoi TaxID=267567 RepID=A0AAD8YJX3_9STRA|nr:hypothetical protein QTG54_002213 [Skeletonema marinoi]